MKSCRVQWTLNTSCNDVGKRGISQLMMAGGSYSIQESPVYVQLLKILRKRLYFNERMCRFMDLKARKGCYKLPVHKNPVVFPKVIQVCAAESLCRLDQHLSFVQSAWRLQLNFFLHHYVLFVLGKKNKRLIITLNPIFGQCDYPGLERSKQCEHLG